jgi:hypothetical protein
MSNLISRERRDEIMLTAYRLLRECAPLTAHLRQQQPPPQNKVALDLTNVLDVLRNGGTITFQKD